MHMFGMCCHGDRSHVTVPGRALGNRELAISACSDELAWIDDDHEYEVQGSRSSKALGIGEIFASACSASAPLDRS